MIVNQDIEMTASAEYSDITLPANSWMEFQSLEITASCSNSFLQIWGGQGIKPLFDTRDDVMIIAGVAQQLGRIMGDQRFADYWKFALDGRPEVYIQRLLDASTTTSGYSLDDIMAGKYGEPGVALMLFRTYPRIAFWEQVQENMPFYTDTGRLNAYSDIPEAIEYGDNFIVHREGPEATPYLPNVIVSTNPYIRPDNYGITPENLQCEVMDGDIRTIANNKMSWSEVRNTENPLWREGFRFYALTPKTRHKAHSQWSVEQWHTMWDSNFGDPERKDRRTVGAGEHQMHINPQAASDLDGIVFIDQERCRGYRKCVIACPYKKTLYRPTAKVTEKCVGCYPRIEGNDPLFPGEPLETRCMTACPGKIPYAGTGKDGARWRLGRGPSEPPLPPGQGGQGGPAPLSAVWTGAHGYYIPPRWAPRPYLRQMFGPGVDAAIERYTVPDRELLAVMQLFRATQRIIFRYEIIEGPKVFEATIVGRRWEMYDDTAVGFGKDDQEVARISVQETQHIRPDKHFNSI